PAADGWIVHPGQVFQGFVTAVVQGPSADLPADAHERLRTGSRLEAVREDAPTLHGPHRFPGPELKAQKVEVDVGVVALPVHILAVDDTRLLGMQRQLARGNRD